MIYLVNNAEGGRGEGLKRHEVENRGDRAFASRLAVGCQGAEGLVFSVSERQYLHLRSFQKGGVRGCTQAKGLRSSSELKKGKRSG